MQIAWLKERSQVSEHATAGKPRECPGRNTSLGATSANDRSTVDGDEVPENWTRTSTWTYTTCDGSELPYVDWYLEPKEDAYVMARYTF